MSREASSNLGPHSRSPPYRLRLLLVIVLPLLTAAAFALAHLSSGDRAPGLWLEGVPHRPVEFRQSTPAADVYRPYAPIEGSPVPMPLRAMARLEAQGAPRAIAAAYLLRGNLQQAAAHLQRAPPSPERESDRAALALAQGSHNEALALLERVLETNPHYAQALWNRGLVLRDMGLSLQAASSFEQVARLGEPGWSEEARHRIEALRSRSLERAEHWRAARSAALALVDQSGAALPLEQARRYPGTLRALFYEAVRAAPNRQRALALLPLAQVLDQTAGGSALRDYVLRTAARDFSRRAPLAREYALLVHGRHPEPSALVQRLRAASERDLLLGALLRTRALPRAPREIQALVRGWDDPWIQLDAEEELARLELVEGHTSRSERRMLEALRSCRAQRLAYRCLTLVRGLSDLYVAFNRLAEAEETARTCWLEARALGEWEQENLALLALGQAARFRVDTSAARAYLSESLAREPDNCARQNYVHRNLAGLALLQFRPQQARKHMDLALACNLSVGLHGAYNLSELSRLLPRPDDAQVLRWQLEQASSTVEPPARRALARLIEGRFEIERDLERGKALLRRAIAEAEQLPASDMNARDALADAYGLLAVSAGKAGALGEVLAVVAEQLQVPPPSRCALAAVVDHERLVVVALGPNGEPLGHHDSRREPLGDDLSGLVSEAQVALLRGCEHVDVLAPSPLDSRMGLLPGDLAWSYRTASPARASPVARPPLHLVVADVEPPASLRLARLSPWSSTPERSEQRLELSGAQATPSRVLAAMAEATEVELHAHGLVDRSLSEATLVALAPEEDGRYALTAEQIRQIRLHGAPVVLLAACGAARLPPFLHQTDSLPKALIQAGARAVFAATVDIPDSAGRFFAELRERIRSGTPPALALREQRQRWLRAEPQATWLHGVLLYE